jgi:T-complex protein 1 subunit eta
VSRAPPDFDSLATRCGNNRLEKRALPESLCVPKTLPLLAQIHAPAPATMQPQIVILKEGTESAQGRQQVISNINACQTISDAVCTTLGPRGMDKLMVNDRGQATISNDGATIMKLLDIVHPAAKTLVDIAKSQDAEVGDGTTSVVILACEFLKQCKPFVEEGVHPRVIVKSFRKATQLAVDKIKDLSVKIAKDKDVEKR